MKQFIREEYSVFLTALFQVFFVAMQPLFIVHNKIIFMLITGFLISLIWTFNVKKVAFGTWRNRIVYSTGAMIGTGLGYFISRLIVSYL